MRDDIETELHKQMIHIKHTDDNYEIFDSLRYICEKITQNYYQFKGKKAKKQFDTHKKIIELLENQEIEQISVLDNSKEMIGFKVKK